MTWRTIERRGHGAARRPWLCRHGHRQALVGGAARAPALAVSTHKLLAVRRGASRYPKEDAEQRAVIEWAQWVALDRAGIAPGRKLGEFLLHIPNGGKRQSVEAAILKGIGVKAGVSDLLLALPLHGYAGLWLEMKRARGAYGRPSAQDSAVSREQCAWLALMAEAGYAVAVAYGAEEAVGIIEKYIGGQRTA